MDLSGTMQGAGGVGGLLVVTDEVASGTPAYFPAYDGNGNVTEYLAADGSTAAHYEYDAFGNVIASSGTPGSFEFRFSTKPQDAATGLYYYGYRYYDPKTGRWPSRDPIEEKGDVNLYVFSENSSIDKIDLKDLQAIVCVFQCTRTIDCGYTDFEAIGNGYILLDRYESKGYGVTAGMACSIAEKLGENKCKSKVDALGLPPGAAGYAVNYRSRNVIGPIPIPIPL